MDEVDRSRLRQHRVFFVQTVDVRLLFSPLIQDDILTADDCEFIQSQGRTRMEKAEVFLDMIASKGPNAFVSLCRALKPRYGLLLQRLGLAAEELDELEDSDGPRLRRSSSVGDLLNCRSSSLAGFSLQYASERLQEQIELLNIVQKERDSFLSQLAERNQDTFELNQVRAFQKILEETNGRLLRDRDSALELAAQMKGQCDIIRAQYQEARSTVQQLTAELQSQSKGTEALVLQRICSEVSAKFEIEKANHMKTQLDLNELKARYDRVTKELESLEELKQAMTSNIKKLTGSLKKSQVENVCVSHIMHSASLRCFDTVRRPNVVTQDTEGKLQQQIALLRCEKRRLEEGNDTMEHDLKQLRDHYNAEKHKQKQMSKELDDAIEQQMTAVKQHDAVVDQYNNVCKYAHRLLKLVNDVEHRYQNAEAHCQDLHENRGTAESRLQKMVVELEQLQDAVENSNKELAKERRERMEALKVCMASENKISDKERESKQLKAQLMAANEMQKSAEFESTELKKIVQIAQDRLDAVREKVNDCMEIVEGTDSVRAIDTRKWKMQRSECEITVDSKVMPALSVESALYVVGGGNNSLTAGLRKGDRIVKVNNVAVDQLPAGCLRDNILVPPTDSVTSNFTVTVQRMTPLSCDELLAVLQEPPLMTCCFLDTNDTQWSAPSSPSSTQVSIFSSSTSSSSIQSGPNEVVQKRSFDEGDGTCAEQVDDSRPNQNHQHVKHKPQPLLLALTSPGFYPCPDQFTFQPQLRPIIKSSSLPVPSRNRTPCFAFQPPDRKPLMTDEAFSCFSDRDFPFPLLPKYNETGLLNPKNRKIPVLDTPIRKDVEHPKTVMAGNADVLGSRYVTDEDKSVTSTGQEVVSISGVSLDENAMRTGSSTVTSREEWVSQVKKMVILPSQDRDQSVYIDGKCREVIVHCDGGGDIGIALVGGRGHGLFIWSIEAGSPAARSKLLHPNDEIVEVNGKDMTMATYEEGILALKSCPETVTLAVQENYSKLNMMPPWNKRDTFFIRSLFSTNDNTGSGLSFSSGDILCVLDTIYQDQVGNWYACKLLGTGHVIDEGCIPNIQRASKLVVNASKCPLQHENPRTRPRSKPVIAQQSRPHSANCDIKKNRGKGCGLKECPIKCSVIYDNNIIGYRVATSATTLFLDGQKGTYCCIERCSFKFPRPVVLLGPVAAHVCDSMCRNPNRSGMMFCKPESIVEELTPEVDIGHPQFICNSSGVTIPILEKAAAKGYHCVLSGVSEEGIRRLVSSGLHPIVIYLDPKSARKISSITGASDNEAQSLMASSQKERNGLIWAGLLSAQLQSRGQLKKTLDLTVDLVKILQEALYWLPSKVQL